AIAVTKDSRTAKAGSSGAMLLSDPQAGTRAFGKLASGTGVQIVGKAGSFDKIDLGAGRFAFVADADLQSGGSASGAVAFEDIYAHAPPLVDVKAAAMATKTDRVKITGSATDGERLLDTYIFVGSRKLFYKSNRDGSDPKKATIEFDAPLRPG